METSGRAALVTGGARRIGQAIALSLAALGYDIALHYRSSREEAERTAEQVRTLGVSCSLLRADLSRRAETRSLISKARKAFPELSVLVNNASIFRRGPIAETTESLLDEHLEVNFIAPFLLTRDFAASCTSGVVINLLDTRVAASGSIYAAYTLSKKALAELTRLAAVEFAPAVRVNAVAPGLILPPEGEGPEYLERLALKAPLGCVGSLEAVTSAVVYLLQNDYVTGQVLFVDGGESL
ncbi:SDR family oxidoreductase [bacterium]|nr:SDR family oxidoreductase [bacterium]